MDLCRLSLTPSALGPPPPLAAFLQAADLLLSTSNPSNPSSPPASPADPHFPQTDSLSLKGTAHLCYTPGLLTLPPLSLCLSHPLCPQTPCLKGTANLYYSASTWAEAGLLASIVGRTWKDVAMSRVRGGERGGIMASWGEHGRTWQ